MKGQDIFETVSAVIDDMKLHCIKLCEVTVDGAPAMTGEQNGMVSLVCRMVHDSWVKLHCIIHQEAFCAKAVQFSDVIALKLST